MVNRFPIHRRAKRAPRIVWRLLLLIVAIGALSAPAADAQPLKAIWGKAKFSDGSSAFPVYRDLGVDVYQIQLSWNWVATKRPANPRDPADPAYRWPGTIDYAISQSKLGSGGMEVALLVKGTPEWVGSAEPGTGPTRPPSDAREYADFLVAAAKRYPDVHRWMIWGESNRRAVWSGSAVQYAGLVDAAYGALKPIPLIDPDVVVGGMTFTYGETPPAHWIAAMRMPNGGSPRFDEYGHNPFSRRCPDLSQGPDYLQIGGRDISDIDTLREEVRAAFGAYKPLWLSEYTVSSDRSNRAFSFFVDRSTQAGWLTRAYQIAGAFQGVSGLGWYDVQDEDAANGLTTGLLTVDGAQKPAYTAYKAASMSATGQPTPCPQPSPPPPSPPTSSNLKPSDRVGPKVTVAVKSRIRLKALLRRFEFKVSCNEACRVSGALLIDSRTARSIGIARRSRSALVIGEASRALPAAGSATLKVKISRRFQAKLRKVRRATVTLRVATVDRAGNATRKTRTIRLTR